MSGFHVLAAIGSIALTIYLIAALLYLPLNPEHFGAVSSDSAFNTAISFVTNTNWQGYSGESTMSPLTQMLALTVQNFLSAATGIAVAFALMRAFVRKETKGLGNFWIDLFRITVYVLLRGETDIHLTPIEYRLLTTLVTNAGKVLTHRQLLRDVWGPQSIERSHYLRIYMAQLRQKLEADPTRPRHLLTETGVGYRLQA
jgi:hypothetical protein